MTEMFCCLILIPVLNFPPANHMLPDETMPPANCNVKNIFHCQRAESVICSCCRAVNPDAASEKGKRIFSRVCNVWSKLRESLSPARFCAMKMKYRQHADTSFSNTTLSIFWVKVMAHPENRGERDPPTRIYPKVYVVELLKGRRSVWTLVLQLVWNLFMLLCVCLCDRRATSACRAAEEETCWHAATAHWTSAQRGLFWGTFRSLGPRQKALIKRSSRVGGKWVISCAVAPDGANSFASSQHLQPLSWTNLTPAPWSDLRPSRALRLRRFNISPYTPIVLWQSN